MDLRASLNIMVGTETLPLQVILAQLPACTQLLYCLTGFK